MFHLKHPESCLWLIGPPFVKDDIQIQKWDERGLLKGVHLAGAVRHDDLIPILDHSTLLVHPSLEESFGNTLIEAMARQVPVLGGIHSGAVPYVLDYGRAGCLCDITSATDIYDKMELIHNNLIYREKLIQHATQLIQERYIDSKVIQQHIDLYHNLISNTLCNI
jgi:glycosyltransferase involved in cell wall biosynthesis